MANERDVDALVIGAGPAGSTAGALLALAGVETLIVESEPFPRFHVGESLLPHTLPLLDRLGVHEAVRDLPHTRRKEGASFVTHDGSRHVAYWFADAFPPAIPHAYQVRRDEFDAALLANAVRCGAQLISGWRAAVPQWEGRRITGVRLRNPEGREQLVRCRVALDASGQATFLASRMGWRFPYPRHRKSAAVAHFEGAWLPAGREAGNITIALTDGGWFWLIPFADDTVSVGVVLDVERWRDQPGPPESVFRAAVEATPEVARRLASATAITPFAALQNFSYRVLQIGGDGFCCLGDAAGFLDPVFSTGVFLATTTAAAAAQDVSEALARHGRVDGPDLGPTIALTRSLHRRFFSFIRAFYDPDFLAFFFDPHDAFRIPAAVVSLLAADVLRPGRWRRAARYRALLALAELQHWGSRLGRPIVEPLPLSPAARPRG